MLRTLSTACVHIDNMISGAISQTREEKKIFFYNFSEFQNLGAHISQNIYILEKSSTCEKPVNIGSAVSQISPFTSKPQTLTFFIDEIGNVAKPSIS